MGKSYLGTCEDVYKNGKWVQTETTAVGVYNTHSGSIWRGLRCRTKKTSKAYAEVSNDFEDFQSFVEWHRAQIGYDLGWHLDKDLFGDGSSYSSEMCCLLPGKLNVLMQGIGSWKRGELVGASYFKRDSNWRAYGNDFYSQVHLGYHKTQEEAHRAWKVDKAQRIKEYDKTGLTQEIVESLEKLVDTLNQRGAEYTHRHANLPKPYKGEQY
ncbi:hypothetical protein vB_PsyM_KIL4_0147 [Pseudomonas phage vB_PsyM_KIL4]|uniref:Uncharacterized protein n=2 Tax=Flaumdravirus TaxID=2560133 RepID=A0A142IF66_9CAUD|nr:HNH endonuclease [Pseudomonas phage vB_PsyM_KIL4]AMR57871.1 hypothetical protein vB_PsyM_KIL4_0147 [Pseudomonas phage vB_PsyM_KIL4]AMR58040.1 hypothetical protein vB_PsyM_KIL5_0149 [Pseudomonas phage vB_PsyM_KIL5]